ncbi:hypothetical protein GCM10023231_01270 [Olivibacter ginsenosidimutans]|uniref:Uncharacterized protein n=1 Tax=Olivibacter ginsenosidimutans TaxID=1176537 RepID=A0ABP9ADX0_9SPHI
MKKVFKKIKSKMTYGNIVSMFAVAFAITLMSFKFIESRRAPADGWYEITISGTDPEEESNQNLSNTPGQAPPSMDETGCAQSGNSGDRCYAHLEFETSATSVPSTVQDAKNDSLNVTILGFAQAPEE